MAFVVSWHERLAPGASRRKYLCCNTRMRSRPRPFISYAREDRRLAERLYNDLRKHGVDPWIDTQKMVAGQKWRDTIRRAIRKATHVIVLISRNSVAKTGYVQAEIKVALSLYEEMPDERVFLIPVRLDDSEPTHEVLRDLQWVELGGDYDSGLDGILEALKIVPAARREAAVVGELLGKLGDAGTLKLPKLNRLAGASRSRSSAAPILLPTRREIYREAIRLIADADVNDESRATAPLFDRAETGDRLFQEYLDTIAQKCREATRKHGKFAHHALFAFSRKSGRIPPGVKTALQTRQRIFADRNVADRLHLYETASDTTFDILVVGTDRAIIAFPEDTLDRRLQHGLSISGIAAVSSLLNWYNHTIAEQAWRLSSSLRRLPERGSSRPNSR